MTRWDVPCIGRARLLAARWRAFGVRSTRTLAVVVANLIIVGAVSAVGLSSQVSWVPPGPASPQPAIYCTGTCMA